MSSRYFGYSVNESLHFSFGSTGKLDPVVFSGFVPQEIQSRIVNNIYKATEVSQENDRRENKNNERDLKTGITMYLLISHDCPLSCTYCLAANEAYRKSQHLLMTPQIAVNAVLSCLPKIVEGGKLDVLLFGGEPLLGSKYIKEIVSRIKEEIAKSRPDIKLLWNITSSLAILPEKIIPILSENQFHILCDVDGPAEVHNCTRPFSNGKGSFESIVKNVNRLRSYGLLVNGRATITSHNVHILSDVLKIHKEIGFWQTGLVPVVSFKCGGDLIDSNLLPSNEDIYKGLRKALAANIYPPLDLFPQALFLSRLATNNYIYYPCGAPNDDIVVVEADGAKWPCIYFLGEKANRKGLGNVQGLAQTLEKRKSVCAQCSLLPLCGGGCIAEYAYFEDNKKQDIQIPWCAVAKATIDHIFEARVAEIKSCSIINKPSIIRNLFVPDPNKMSNLSEICIVCCCESCTASCTQCTGSCTYCLINKITDFSQWKSKIWDGMLHFAEDKVVVEALI